MVRGRLSRMGLSWKWNCWFRSRAWTSHWGNPAHHRRVFGRIAARALALETSTFPLIARRDSDETAGDNGDAYVINGTKWFITGADGAGWAIIMARMEDGSATMFLSDMTREGIKVERLMDPMDSCFVGGHGVVTFTDVRVPAADVLGELGKGFRYAQVRLAPARLTHCMRWLGQARRAHDTALDYARHRKAFGHFLGEHEGRWLHACG